MAINILDKHTANLIAAGEVVERPASAIKEMLENSADAGATRVTVEIKNGGTSYFRVTDNGSGMSKDDLPKSVLRHATSKIATSADLMAIGTYGFRGEALAAIAAVCDLKILTKRKEDDFGSVLHINSGEIIENGEAGCPDGTTIAASGIFMNVPARRKFLKKDVSESSACLAVTEKFALSRPDIAVTFISDGNIKLKTTGDGILKNTIYSCLGKEFSAKLLPLDYLYEGIKISGFIGKPETARPSRSMQNFFINQRYIRSGTICAALEEGFRAFCPAGKFPAAVIFCDIDFSRVDVNIHPAKTEVKFSEEKKVFDAVLFAVRTALNKGTSFVETQSVPKQQNDIVYPQNDAVKAPEKPHHTENITTVNIEKPRLSPAEMAKAVGIDAKALPQKSTETLKKADEETKAKIDLPFGGSDIPPVRQEKKAPDFRNAFADDREGLTSGHTVSFTEPLFVKASLPTDNMQIFTPPKKEETAPVKEEIKEEQISFELPEEEIKKPKYRVIGECFDSFILVEKDDVLYIIDKHAAHERILYEQIKNADTSGSQTLIEPVRINLTTEEFSAICENSDYFKNTGFSFDTFGTNTLLVRAFPQMIERKDLNDIFSALAAKLIEGNGHAAGDLFNRALFSAACKAAVKAGQRNSLMQDEYIAEKIFSSEAILYCPHGRPVITEFTKEKLYRTFKRT